MGKFLKILFFLFIVLTSGRAYSVETAKSVCNLILEESIERYGELKLSQYFYDQDEWFPFEPSLAWDRDLETWIVKTDSKGYWIVSDKLRAKKYEDLKVFPGDRIIKIDGVKVQDIKPEKNLDYITIDQYSDIIYPTNDQDEYTKRKINLTIIDTNNIKKDVELELFTYESSVTEFDFEIHSINSIDIKKNDVEIFFTRKAMWANPNLAEIAVKHMVLDETTDQEKLYENYSGGCVYSEEEWNLMQVPSPGWGITELNAITFDQDQVKKTVVIDLYSKKIGDKDLEEDTVEIVEYTKGLMRFSNTFKLQAFPFDKQILSFRFVNEGGIFSSLSASISVVDYLEQNLSDFLIRAREENLVPGWDIVNYSIKHFLHTEPISPDFYQDGLEIKIEVQRNYEYYIFKVIFPIILILLICWSVFWIHPRELESKLTITIVCLLSLIAYNFVIEEDLPKLSYLTIMDHLVLISYIFATIPNLLSILSFRLYTGGKKLKLKLPLMSPIVMSYVQIDNLSKRWGLLTYILIMLLIILFNVKGNEYTAGYLAWLR